jgi:MoxR-like ATPase
MAVDLPGAITIEQLADLSCRIIREVGKAIVGKRETCELMLAAFLSTGGHVLLEDYPGLAEPLIASSFARALGLNFKRLRLSIDLLPEELVGGYVFDGERNGYAIRKGPIFANLLLVEEIRRASPKTQATLLEAMDEGQVVLEGKAAALPNPFIVIATQSPAEDEVSFPLSEAQLERFMMRLSVGYPLREEEEEILRRRVERRRDAIALDAVATPEILSGMREAVEKVHVDPDIRSYMVSIAAKSRRHPDVAVGASPRGSMALLKLSRAWAAMQGRDYVVPEDVMRLAGPALAHRMEMDQGRCDRGSSGSGVIDEIVRAVPVPSVNGHD